MRNDIDISRSDKRITGSPDVSLRGEFKSNLAPAERDNVSKYVLDALKQNRIKGNVSVTPKAVTVFAEKSKDEKKAQAILDDVLKNISKITAVQGGDIDLVNKISSHLYNALDGMNSKEIRAYLAKVVKATKVKEGDLEELSYEDGGWDVKDSEVQPVIGKAEEIAKILGIK